MPARRRIGHRHGDLTDPGGLDCRTPGGQPAISDPDHPAKRGVGWSQCRLVREGDETRSGARRKADLLEPVGGEEGRDRPVPAFVRAGGGEREQRDQRDHADGEHSESEENLRQRQSLLLRKEPQVWGPRGW